MKCFVAAVNETDRFGRTPLLYADPEADGAQISVKHVKDDTTLHSLRQMRSLSLCSPLPSAGWAQPSPSEFRRLCSSLFHVHPDNASSACNNNCDER